jgi:secondary thiamine-phosphate synthase enzyme
MVVEHRWTVALDAEFGHRDITPELEAWVADSGVATGLVAVQVVGSTGGITTIEYETGALRDLRRAVESLAPAAGHYEHNARWGDGNGFSHVRSALLKTALVLPVVGGRLQLGTWQQVVVINFDNRSREREVVAVMHGTAAGT